MGSWHVTGDSAGTKRWREMWREGWEWQRNLERRAGVHRSWEVFAPRGSSRTGVFMIKPYSLGHAPRHPTSVCPGPMVATAWSTTTWVGCAAWHRITGGQLTQTPRGKAIALLRRHASPSPFPEQSQHLQLGALG